MNNLHLLNSLLWKGVLIYLFLFVGIYLTIRLKGLQFRYFFTSLYLSFSRKESGGKGDITPFQSLMTSLAATIGIGSITGMATALVAGGFGAIFWMWVVSLLGLIIKYSEALLAIKYREIDHRNEMCGGPMQYIEKGLGYKKLAVTFAFFGACAAFFGGNVTQSQSIAEAVYELTETPMYITGMILAFCTAIVILGGIKTLGKVNAYLVPIMGLTYFFGGIIVLVFHMENISGVFNKIVLEAFNLSSAVRGISAVGFMHALQMGIVRGICSNEAGLGSAPIAAAAAKTKSSIRLALINMTGVFLSSFVVCTLTVLIIGVTGVAENTSLNGAPLVMRAFETTIPYGSLAVTLGILLFGYSTILGWSYYGEKCIEYLFGERVIKAYRVLFIGFVFFGSLLKLEVVWALVDLTNGLMALPNLLAVFLLTPVLVRETQRFEGYFSKVKKRRLN